MKKNIVWNAVGLALPLAIAALTIPQLLTLIGSERFGFLSMAWGLVGYAGMLDMGVGRATTRQIAALIGTSNQKFEIAAIVGTARKLTWWFGFAAAILFLPAGIPEWTHWFHALQTTSTEIRLSIFILAFTLPLQALSATDKGINEAFLNFRAINIIRILLGASNFALPLFVAHFTLQLHWLIASLFFSRALAFLLYRTQSQQCLDKQQIDIPASFHWNKAKDLLRFGGWSSVSNLLGFLLMQSDRYLIGFFISAAAVTLYVIPYEICVQSSILASAISSVAFPAITRLLRQSEAQAMVFFAHWQKRIALLMALMLGMLAYILPYLLNLWLGANAHPASVMVGRILVLGVWANSLGFMSFALIHAKGNPRIAALIHIAEVPFYLLLLYVAIPNFGLKGAAGVWVVRMVVDTIAMHWASRKPSAQVI